jgi:hypothetical protein
VQILFCVFFAPVYTLSPRNYRISLPVLTFYLIRSQQTTDISLLFIIPAIECACHVLDVYSDIFSAFASDNLRLKCNITSWAKRDGIKIPRLGTTQDESVDVLISIVLLFDQSLTSQI